MVSLNEMLRYTNQLLAVEAFQDYCPNGLQVEGRSEVRKLVSGVSASQAFIEAALIAKADALLVHHGYFWKNEAPAIVGIKRIRLRSLLINDMSLLAYHLPLDAHSDYGNNVMLARHLHFIVEGSDKNFLFYGRLHKTMAPTAFAEYLQRKLGREPLFVAGSDKPITTLAWCTGGAQRLIENAVDLGVDAYLTGEASESTVHIARECGIHFFAAGHHATERYGANALGQHLAQRFSLQYEFIDIDNPA